MSNKATILPCPTCQKSIVWSADNEFRPFCSERCKLIDLGAWSAEEHRIAGQPVSPIETGDLASDGLLDSNPEDSFFSN